MRSTKPRSARRELTRDRLLDAATSSFAGKGYGATSVEDICELAGFTRGAFYSNFASKDEVVIELAQRAFTRTLAELAAAADRGHDTIEELVADALRHRSASPKELSAWLMLHLEFTLHALRDRAAGRAWARQQRQIRSQLSELIASIAASRGLCLRVAPEVYARAAMAAVVSGAADHLLEPRRVAAAGLAGDLLPALIAAPQRTPAPVS